MQKFRATAIVTGMLFLSAFALASTHRSQKALWIELKEKGGRTSTIAMTENIARQLLESDDTNLHFSKKRERDLITKEMLRAVLDGRQESAEVSDDDGGSKAKLYMADLHVPANKGGGDRLVVETYKAGEKTFRIALPSIDIADAEEGTGNEIETSIGWKSLLPFLSHGGGALYVRDEDHDSEVWIYVD